jgi:hypothetical protein
MKAADQPDEPLGIVRYDLGGWNSGPCLDPPPPPVTPRIGPPGSTRLRELAHAIATALALSPVRHRAGRAFVPPHHRGPGHADTPGLPEDHG